jgi:transposase
VKQTFLTMQTLYQLPDSLWEKVRTTIEPKPRRRKVSLQTVLSGIIYLLSNGCKWRSLPPQYGDYRLVWYYLNQWAVYGVLDQVLDLLGLALRTKQGRSEEPSLVIVDAQAVKTTAGTGDEVGYDAGKKIKGRKRHLATDTQGNVMAAGVTSAFVHDKTGARVLREDVEDRSRVKKIVADGAYGGEPPFDRAGTIEWQIIERLEKGKFTPLPIRWIVERTFAWLVHYRRLVRDYEKTVVMSRAMLVMCAIHITLKKLMT